MNFLNMREFTEAMTDFFPEMDRRLATNRQQNAWFEMLKPYDDEVVMLGLKRFYQNNTNRAPTISGFANFLDDLMAQARKRKAESRDSSGMASVGEILAEQAKRLAIGSPDALIAQLHVQLVTSGLASRGNEMAVATQWEEWRETYPQLATYATREAQRWMGWAKDAYDRENRKALCMHLKAVKEQHRPCKTGHYFWWCPHCECALIRPESFVRPEVPSMIGAPTNDAANSGEES